MSEPNKVFPVSWEELHRHARALSWRLSEKGPFKGIVAVTRGGLVPAGILARELDIRLVDTICVASYHSETEQREAQIIKGFDFTEQGEGWLIVDDLVDTGKTFELLRKIAPRAHFATVYAKPAGRPLVDTFITEVSQDTWIYFPWDIDLAYSRPIVEQKRA